MIGKNSKPLSSQKLWVVEKQANGNYYYVIRCRGAVIDRIKIEEPTITLLKELFVI